MSEASPNPNLSLSGESELMLSIFARRNNGLFIVDGPRPAEIGGESKGLDVYCVFGQEALPYALLAARNAMGSLAGMEVRYHACRDSDGPLLNAICARSRVFGERRRAAR